MSLFLDRPDQREEPALVSVLLAFWVTAVVTYTHENLFCLTEFAVVVVGCRLTIINCPSMSLSISQLLDTRCHLSGCATTDRRKRKSNGIPGRTALGAFSCKGIFLLFFLKSEALCDKSRAGPNKTQSRGQNTKNMIHFFLFLWALDP